MATVALSLVSGFSTSSVAASGSRFGPAATYQPGGDGVVAGDFTNNGMVDLMAFDNQDSGIYFYRGLGGGLFAAPVLVGQTNDDNGGYLLAAHLTPDGNLDLILSSSDAAVFYVWLGNGNGTFEQFNGTEYYNGSSAGVLKQVAVADFNGDDWPDIVAVGEAPGGSGLIQIWCNNHNGTFTFAKSFAEGSGLLSSVVAADFNGDGHLDFAVANFDAGYVVPFYGDGHLGFQRGTPLTTPTPIDLATADLNLDGHPDLLVSNLADNQVTEFLHSDGGFRPGAVVPVGDQPWQTSVADFIRSGPPGFVVANSGDDTASVFAGDGRGDFTSLGTYAMSGSGPVGLGDLRSVIAPALSGDGLPDLVGANQEADTVVVRLGQRV
ncbi:MAG: VCBS repeat-containing protein [Candidatus Dormibacteria bacterium]|jgi:hypothetical protein